VLTRPAGTATSLAEHVREQGGEPLLLPGMSLQESLDPVESRERLMQALDDEIVIFTSPAAVHFAAQLMPLRATATVLAVGQGTATSLRKQGIENPQAPARQDSEGLLDHPALQALHGRRVALIGAAGGRALLRETLAARGADLREVHVYQRLPPQLTDHQINAVQGLTPGARVMWSSVEALHNLRAALPSAAWAHLCSAVAVVSSDRLAGVVRAAGFARISVAASALSADLLATAMSPD